jgi:hypothetical protein
MRIARLTLPPGAARPGRPPAGKSYIRRQSAIQLLGSRRSPNRSPLVPENANKKSSVPALPGKRRFQLYDARIMLCPSRNAATENSTGIVGTDVGAASGSTSLRPFVKTSSRTAAAQIRGR